MGEDEGFEWMKSLRGETTVGIVFQSYALFPNMRVRENVAYGLTVSGTAKSASREHVEAALELVGLAGYDDRLPSKLSGGQRQRVAVARAVVLEPEILLFDAPLSSLDAKLRRRVREEELELQQKLGITSTTRVEFRPGLQKSLFTMHSVFATNSADTNGSLFDASTHEVSNELSLKD